MLQQIIINTPIWVWPLLSFLIYRGVVASRSREIALKKTLIIPLVMLALSLHGIASAFGADAAAMLIWLVGALGATLASWRLFDDGGVAAHPERGIVFQSGSWLPLTLMMSIFFTKYAVGVMLALDPSRAQDAAFAAAVCGLYGMFNGIFIGRMLRVTAIYRNAQTGAMVVPAPAR